MVDPQFVASVRSAVGAEHVLTDPDVTASYATDYTGRFVGAAPVVVRPATTDEVAAVVGACRTYDVAVVPQGGNTGLVGGGVPLAGEIVLSLERMTTIDVLDAVAGQLTAGAGVTIASVHRAARDLGWSYGVDLAARDSATVGGTIATNAGGERVLRYGTTREQVIGVEAVLGDGSVVSHLNGLLKDNTGYHYPSLLCGSEGTLAVITAARLRLVPTLEWRVVALVGFESAAVAIEACGRLRRLLDTLDAVELFFADGLRLVRDAFDLPDPIAPSAAYLLVECAAPTDPSDAMADVIAGLDAVDVAVALDAPQRAALWRYREGHTEAINGLGPPHKLDVTLPAAALAGFVDEVRARVSSVAPSATTWLFGHAADGNLHVNITGVDPDDERVDDAVLALVADRGGSISVEHGIGTAKRRWLHLNRSASELRAIRAIKHALDPDAILNPNALLP